MKKIEVGLFGTCNNSQWREELIPMLKCDYYNPVVVDWTPECQEVEKMKRQTCDFVLYVITPKMTGSFAIAEVTDDSNKRPEKTIFCFLPVDGELQFTEHQGKSLKAVKDLVESNGASVFNTLAEVADYLNLANEIFYK